MIDGLFERALHVPIWLLSLGNAVVGIDELESKMTRLGRRTKAIEIAYQHLPAVATEAKKATNKEFLVVGWDQALLAHNPHNLQNVSGETHSEDFEHSETTPKGSRRTDAA